MAQKWPSSQFIIILGDLMLATGSGLPHTCTHLGPFQSIFRIESYTFGHIPLKLTAHVMGRPTVNIHILWAIRTLFTHICPKIDRTYSS